MTDAIKVRGGAVDLIDLSKQYGNGEPYAVDSANLSIVASDFVTLLGPSGSGKTTTLNMIAGFIAPTSGRIEHDGVDLAPVPTHKRNFGMVFQNYSLFPHMTAWENIAFPLKERRLRKGEVAKLVDDVVHLVELQGLEGRKPAQLSGGQQQRVALARAIVYAPRVLLLDEPLGALDRKLRQTLQNQIRRIHRELGTTFIFVTHDQEEAMFLSDRIAVFNEGRIERVGSPSALYDDPGTLFVAEFVGESNVFRGALAGGVYEWRDNRWRAQSGGDPAGSPVLIVRPERVSLATDEEKVPSGYNSAQATVTNYAFLGTVRRVELDFGSETQGCAVLPANEAVTARPGDKVFAHWSPDHQALVSP